jgi:hypothetical protein
MVKQVITPTATLDSFAGDSKTRYDHPAFGKVVLSHPTGNVTLFGSDVAHHGSMCISLYRAHLDRHLNHDYIGEDRMICQFELSAAQFAQFITSQGSGSVTPCTLSYGPEVDSKLVDYPAINKIESKMDMHKREVRESASEQIKKIKKSFDAVNALMDSPSIPKKAMKEALFDLKCMIDNTPSNMEYSVSSAEKALEKAVSDAKIEIESFVAITTQRLGIKSLEQLGQIANKVEQGIISLENEPNPNL